MFCVIYHWKRKTGITDKQFQDHWHKGTIHIYKTFGSYGSSLHKMKDGTYIAYARWPDRKHWEKMMKTEAKYPNKPLVDALKPPMCLELLNDMLTDKQFKK